MKIVITVHTSLHIDGGVSPISDKGSKVFQGSTRKHQLGVLEVQGRWRLHKGQESQNKKGLTT